MKKRVVPIKNYIIFIIIAMVSFIVVFNLAKWYKDLKEEYENKNIMSEIVSSVYENDIENFIVENESFTLYLASSTDKEVKDFERDFEKLIVKKNIVNHIIYLDTNNITNESFYTNFKNKYFIDILKTNNINLNIRPNLVHFNEHKIDSVLYSTEKKINIDEVEQFLINNEVFEQ